MWTYVNLLFFYPFVCLDTYWMEFDGLFENNRVTAEFGRHFFSDNLPVLFPCNANTLHLPRKFSALH